MSDYVVAKPFNTAIQRFRKDADVSPLDDLAPHSFWDLKKRGFIAERTPAFDPVPVLTDAMTLDTRTLPSPAISFKAAPPSDVSAI